LVLEQFPQVIFAFQDYCKVDFSALAQHYELNTNLLDVTCDIATAAFFATHYYDSNENEYRIIESGTGCIRAYMNILFDYDENQPFRMIGLQPFWRPGLQCAFAIKMMQGENFANFSHKILFKQSAKWNQKIHDMFYLNGKNILFPDEEIANAAKRVKKSSEISILAIKKYCADFENGQDQVIRVLNENGYSVVEKLNYTLSEQQRKEFESRYKKKPYGDAVIRTRLCYIPPN
jgi:hypothetical protein